MPPQYSITGRPPANCMSHRMSSAEEHSPVELKSLIEAQYVKVKEIEDFEIYERSEHGS